MAGTQTHIRQAPAALSTAEDHILTEITIQVSALDLEVKVGLQENKLAVFLFRING